MPGPEDPEAQKPPKTPAFPPLVWAVAAFLLAGFLALTSMHETREQTGGSARLVEAPKPPPAPPAPAPAAPSAGTDGSPSLPAWRSFTAAEGHFEIQFPGQPTENKAAVPAMPAAIETVYLADAGDYTYSATAFESPDPNLEKKGDLMNCAKGAAANINGDLVSSEFLVFQGHAALDFVVKAPAQYYVKCRSFSIGAALYQLSVGSPREEFQDFDRFVNSFHYLGAQAPVAATPAPADETIVKLKIHDPPWHLVDLRWDLGEPAPFESLSVDFEVGEDVDPSINLYIAPIGLGSFDGRNFYGGIQTNMGGFVSKTDHRMRTIGRGAIFSRWGVRSLEAVRLGPGGVCESAGYEGDFVSVRNRFRWTKGKYTLRLARMDTERRAGAVYTWVGMRVAPRGAGEDVFVGALRFEGSSLTLSPQVASFVEIYGGPLAPERIPRLEVVFGNLRVNGRPVGNLKASADYAEGVPDYAQAQAEGRTVRVSIGRPVRRGRRRVTLF